MWRSLGEEGLRVCSLQVARLGAREGKELRGWMTLCVCQGIGKPRGPMVAGKQFPCKKGEGVVMFYDVLEGPIPFSVRTVSSRSLLCLCL